jgi:hypothetical protein
MTLLPARWIAIFALCAIAAPGQSRPVDVQRGSPERKAILDALRPTVEKDLKQKVQFVVHSLKMQKGFAFAQLEPQKPGGAPIDYSRTRYAEAIKAGAFDNFINALLRKEKKRWRLLRYSLGATDVPYVNWDREFKAPRALFGLPPNGH